jgi:site-specific recombinase XerD
LNQSPIKNRVQPILNKLFNVGLSTDDRKNRVVIHTFRHTFASHLAINGIPIFTIQKLMNHKKIEQTLRYAKLSPENGRNAIQGLYK